MSTEIERIVSKINYLAPPRYISGRIIEYDMKSANISVLRTLNIISEEEYIRLSLLPKMQREIEIGLMEKADPKIYTELQKGIKEAKMIFAKNNNIDHNSIVRVANDAIYINTPIDLQYTKINDYIEFRKKSESEIYINLNKVILFLHVRQDGAVDVDVKGISETNVALHQPYMINCIVSSAIILERAGIEEAVNYLSTLIEQYLHLELPAGYYRQFNPTSKYLSKLHGINNDVFCLDYIDEVNKYSIDINYNYGVLRELWSILVEIYTLRRRR